MPRAVMRSLLALIALGSCAASDLEQRINALFDARLNSLGFAGIHVVDLASGTTLYRRNEDRLFLPASNWKLFTTALALNRLGRDYRLTTRVLLEPSGNLVLVGGGDPSFSGFLALSRTESGQNGSVKNGSRDTARNEPLTALEALAEQIVASGITHIVGDIVGDDTAFAWEPHPQSWTQDDTVRDFGAPVSALVLHDNVVSVSIASGSRTGDSAVLTLTPQFEYFTIDNRVTTAAPGGQTKVNATRIGNSRQWRLEGTIAAGRSVTENLPVDDPALFGASALSDALTRRGVTIRGRPVARHRNPGDAYNAPVGQEIATHGSPPLAELLEVMDKLSVNLYAEVLLREVGRSVRAEGTTSAGLAELAVYLKEIGAPTGDWRADDGSGLSRNDLVTPRLLVQILIDQYRKNGDDFVAMLPAGGEEGTLDRRLCCVSEGRGVHAKTGTLARAIALSGYAESKTNGRLAFSILVNDFWAPASEIRAWIDKIATALLEVNAK